MGNLRIYSSQAECISLLRFGLFRGGRVDSEKSLVTINVWVVCLLLDNTCDIICGLLCNGIIIVGVVMGDLIGVY